jgi:hypothetical protein
MKTLTRIYLPLLVFLCSCGINKNSFSPGKKFSPEELEADYDIYQKTLELHHPSLYWYSPADSMNLYFQWGREQIKSSLTEPEFRKVLNYVTSKINCGHTSVRASKAFNKYLDTARVGRLFPLSIKIWDSAMVVTVNLSRRDTILKRGTVINSINGKSWRYLADTMIQYIPTDGYNHTSKFQSLSNRGFFGSLYTSLFGLSERYNIEYRDANGQLRSLSLPVYDPAKDTAGRAPRLPGPAIKPSRRERRELQLNSVRLLKMDTVNKTAMMDLASFGRGYGLRRFFRNSFRTLEKFGIPHLIIDVRSNGGGSIGNSTYATRFLSDHKFKIADSLFAIRKHSSYSRYIKDHFWNNLFISIFTKKKSDGYYHFGYFNRHYFKPRRKDHYNGKVYILTGGNSFSATTLFVAALIKQENVVIIGEETGGGAYGNSAWLLPDVKLPATGVRIRMPLFRLVIDKTVPKNGRGVQPEVPSLPTIEAIRRNIDFKVQTAMELIMQEKQKTQKK